MINPMKLMQLKPQFSAFTSAHPKFMQFLSAAHRSGITEGTIVEVSIKKPDGTDMCTNIKLTQDDLELFKTVAELRN